jgi:hypothetical protein
MNNNWQAPLPRKGLAGVFDKFVGPGATPAELSLQLVLPVLAAVGAPWYAARVVGHWSWFQYVVCAGLAFDLVGGIITNATSSAKRWYHRAGQGWQQHLGFVAIHLAHLLVVAWLYLAFNLGWLLLAGGYLLAAAAAVLAVPHYLQRPVALAAYAGALLLAVCGLAQPAGLEWFLPLFYLKLLVSHLPKETPFRPSEETRP